MERSRSAFRFRVALPTMFVVLAFAWAALTSCSSAPSDGGNTNNNTNDNTVGNTNDNVPDNTNDNTVDNTNDNVVNDDLIPSACCVSDGSCTVATREQCDGAFVGGGTPCSPTSCEVAPFTNEAAERGIVYRALFPRSGANVVPGSGIAFVDLDDDGDFDLVALGHVGDGLVGVFEADGRGHFTDRSADSGIAPDTWARALVAGDYDADGDLDLYLSNWAVPNRLLRNDGGFHFSDVTATAGVGKVGHGAGCTWGDYDGDGWLDLYATDYLLDGPNSLYHNRGDGTFEDVAEALGVASDRRAMQAAFFDFDGDADLDLYVANDLQGGVCSTCCNEMYVNNGDGTFTKAGDETGANACVNAMCIAVGDINNDQTLDMFFTDDGRLAGNVLIVNQGDGTFVDASSEAAVLTSGVIAWGAMMFDFDNDGHLELFVTYGCVNNRFFRGDGTFPMQDIAAEVGLDNEGQSYCTAVSDVDNDGDLDFILWNRQEDLYLYINQEGQKRRWVKFNVIGEGNNLRGIGTTVAIRSGPLRQVRQVFGFNNFKGMDEERLHFGLNTARVVDEIRVTWPGGHTRTLINYPGNQIWTLYPPGRMGDVSGDGVVTADDRAALEACRGAVRPGCEMMDLDGDADIDDADQAAQ